MKYSILFSFLFLAQFAFSQDVSWGPEYISQKNETMEEFVAKDKDGFYVLKSKQRSSSRYIPVLDHYDKKMKLRYSRPMSELDRPDVFYTDLFQFNDKLYVAFTKFKPQDKKHVLYFNEIKKEDGSLIDVPKKIAQIFSDKRLLQGEFQFGVSPDSSKAVILFSEIDGKRSLYRNIYGNFDGSSVKFSLTTFDNNMQELWQKEIVIPYDEELVERSNLVINNKGNVHVVAKIYENSPRERVRGEVNFNYKIFSFYKGGVAKEYTFDLGDKFISEITMRANRKNELICSGFYSERSADDVKGAFYFTIDEETREMSQKKLTPFQGDFLATLLGERRAKKGRELQGYVLRDLILRSDNGAVLIAEQFFTRIVSLPDYSPVGGVQYREVIYYHYNDIIVVNLNPDGSIAWATNIDKSQVSTNPTYSSFASAVVRDKLYFVYNEGTSKRQSVNLGTVTSKGESRTQDLFTNREAEVITVPKLSRQIARNELVIYGQLRKRFRFAKIKF